MRWENQLQQAGVRLDGREHYHQHGDLLQEVSQADLGVSLGDL